MARKASAQEEHQRILREVLREQNKDTGNSPKGWMYALIAVIIITLMALWVVPPDVFPQRARLSAIPLLSELPIDTSTPIVRPIGMNIEEYVSIDATTNMVAGRIVSAACSQPDKHCYAQAIYYFVRDHIRYINDPVHEYYEMPLETLRTGGADCDGQAILTASLLQSVGVRTRFVFVPGHVYVEAWLPKKSLLSTEYTHEWVPLDPTCSQCRFGTVIASRN